MVIIGANIRITPKILSRSSAFSVGAQRASRAGEISIRVIWHGVFSGAAIALDNKARGPSPDSNKISGDGKFPAAVANARDRESLSCARNPASNQLVPHNTR
jgi:hypothetical protein